MNTIYEPPIHKHKGMQIIENYNQFWVSWTPMATLSFPSLEEAKDHIDRVKKTRGGVNEVFRNK